MSKQKITLTTQSPMLSTSRLIQPFRSRKICQRCASTKNVSGWIEHDHNDKPEPIYVYLCKKCSDELIGPHVRLYAQMWENTPYPGVMDICADCRWRQLAVCLCPLAKFNGGAGLEYDIAKPATAHLNYGGGRGEWRHIYSEPAKGCSGKQVAA